MDQGSNVDSEAIAVDMAAAEKEQSEARRKKERA